MEHTPEPWYDDGYRIYGHTENEDKRSGHVILEYKHMDGVNYPDYHRIVACVNACKGLSTADLEMFMANLELNPAASRLSVRSASGRIIGANFD